MLKKVLSHLCLGFAYQSVVRYLYSEMDETYIKIKGKWRYLYRAVESTGQTVDFLLRAQREGVAAKAFFKKALSNNGKPDKITIDIPNALQNVGF